ncbi:MAG: substrate-binding domain-containing protein [Kiritimatiellae bacterium]|nr:substrate-binding domain-containing protein [Kiritimatiellia bacterium]
MRKILVALPMANAAARQKLRGIYRFVAEGHDWDIRQVRTTNEFTGDCIRAAICDKTDGFIVSFPDCTSAARELSRTTLPTVAIEVEPRLFSPRAKNIAFLETDNRGIGRAGAEHLRKLGMFRSFGFVSDADNRSWSRMRAAAFAEALADAAGEVAVFASPDNASERESRLGEFLSHLPKPAGVLASWDMSAAQVISLCRARGIRVPGQVAVLGVDNDEYLCESVKPAISTILVDRERQGYDAAAALDRMMRRSSCPRTLSVCRVVRIVERESTAPLTPASHLVKRTLRLIDDMAFGDLTPGAVVARLGVSRRLVDLRLRELGEETLAERIRSRKLAEVRRLLRETSLSDSRIAVRCGFKNVNALRNLFRARFGVSLRQSRAELHPTQDSRKTV